MQVQPTTAPQNEQNKQQSTDQAFSSNEESVASLHYDTQDDLSDSFNREIKETECSSKQKPALTVYDKAKINKAYLNTKIMKIKNQRLLKEREECEKRPKINPKSASILSKKGYDYLPLYKRAKRIIDQKNTKAFLKERMLEERDRNIELAESMQRNKVNQSQADIDKFIDYQFRWKEKIDFDNKLKSILNNNNDSCSTKSILNLSRKKRVNLSQEHCNTKLYLDIEKRKEHQRELEDKYAFPFKPSIHSYNPDKFKQKMENLSNISTNAQMSTVNIYNYDMVGTNPHYSINKNPIKYYKARERQMSAVSPTNYTHNNINLHTVSNHNKPRLNQSWDSKTAKCFEHVNKVIINDNSIRENQDNSSAALGDKGVSRQNELKNNYLNQSSSSVCSCKETDNLFKKLYKLNVSTTSSNGNYRNTDVIASQKTFKMLLEK